MTSLVIKKNPSKALTNKAAKTLGNSGASAKQKSAAGKILANRSVAVRTIKPAPKTGVISRNKIKQAVQSVLVSRKKK